ncbi:MAG: glycosyltransferase [Candidatus Aenigmarchaeota archaeon]|nr:glycosyltransferase [Candidatus Aenigmarchaeota archaeon]
MKNVSVVIPTLNEEASIGKVLNEVPKIDGYRIKVFVVDGLSKDRTAEIARKNGASVIMEKRRGKARSIKTAFRKIPRKTDYIIMLDGDYSYNPSYIRKFLAELKKYDVVLGSRFAGHLDEKSMPKINSFGNIVLTKFANMLYGTSITDLCTGFVGIRKEAADKIKISSEKFELEIEMFTEYLRNKLSVKEIPIAYRKTLSESKVNPVLDGVKDIVFLLKRRFL